MGCKQRCECDNVLYERLVVLKIMKRKTPFHSIERRHAVHRQHLHVLCLSSLLSLWWVWREIWLSPSAVDTWQNDSPFARTSGTITFQMPEGSGIKVTNAQWMATAMGIVIYVGTHCYHSILHGSLNHFGIVYTYVLQALTANNAFILLVITHFFMIFFCLHARMFCLISLIKLYTPFGRTRHVISILLSVYVFLVIFRCVVVAHVEEVD